MNPKEKLELEVASLKKMGGYERIPGEAGGTVEKERQGRCRRKLFVREQGPSCLRYDS